MMLFPDLSLQGRSVGTVIASRVNARLSRSLNKKLEFHIHLPKEQRLGHSL